MGVDGGEGALMAHLLHFLGSNSILLFPVSGQSGQKIKWLFSAVGGKCSENLCLVLPEENPRNSMGRRVVMIMGY